MDDSGSAGAIGRPRAQDHTPEGDPSVLNPKIIGFNIDGKVLGAIKLGTQ